MRTGSVVVAVCLVAACSRVRPTGAGEDEFQSALQDFQNGYSRKALAAAEAYRKSAPPDRLNELDWRMRLVEAESLMTLYRAPLACKILGAPIADSMPTELRSWRLALLGFKCGDSKSEERFTMALAVAGDPASRARVKNYQGYCLRKEALLREARQEADLAGSAYLQAGIARNICFLPIERDRPDLAIKPCREALETARRAGARRLEGIAHANLAHVYAPLGDFENALEHAAEGLRIATEVGDPGGHLAAEKGFGAAYFYMRRMDDAAKHFENVYNVAAKEDIPHDQKDAARDLGAIHQLTEKWGQAERWNTLSRDLAQGEETASDRGRFLLNQGGIATGQGRAAEGYAKCKEVAALKGVKPGLIWEAEACLATASVRLDRFTQAYGHFEEAIRKVDSYRRDLSAESSKITFHARMLRLYRQYVELLVRQGYTERALEVVEASRSPILSARLAGENKQRVSETTYRKIAQRDGVILVSFWLDDPKSFAFIVTASGTRCITLAARDEIDRKVQAFEGLVVNNLGDPLRGSSAATALAGAVLDPIREFIPPNSRVVIALDGPLHRVNLETLPIAEPRPRYWIEDATIAITPSLALLATPPGQEPSKAMLLASGSAGDGDRFPPLGHAEDEISRISARFPAGKPVVLRGGEATPEAYLASNPARFGYIHFTAHGDTEPRDPMQSAIILAPGPAGNRLSAGDAALTPLRATLVTISACRGAGARNYAGEGLIGFGWSFLHAGARNVIAGLWDVSDSTTVDLMDELYGGIAAGMAPADALRAAKLTFIRSGKSIAKPFYWGPFLVFVRSAR